MSIGNYNFMFKFIVVGDTYVGKSNMLIQYTQRKFRGEHEITIGCEFMARNIILNEKNIRIQVWDTAGQEAFRSITRSYYKNSACAVLVYDITNRDSFNNIENWLRECRDMSPKTSTMVLAGNKCDNEEFRQVSTAEAEEFAKVHGLIFLETSAKTGYNVEKLFNLAANEILNRIDSVDYEIKDESNGIKIGTFLGDSQSKNIKISENKHKNKNFELYKKKKCCK